MKTRRELLTALAAGALAWAAPARGQSKPPVLIGWIGGSAATRERDLAAFKEGMAALGWKEGLNYVLEVPPGTVGLERSLSFAQELSARKPAVFVTSTGHTLSAAKAAPNTPVVQAWGGSPVHRGLAQSLAHPGGMVTGVTNISDDLPAKFLELLLAAAPKVKRVGFLADLTSGGRAVHMKHAQWAIEHHRIEARFAEVSRAEEVNLALSRLAKERVEGLVVLPTPVLFTTERQRIANFTLAQRWPAIAGPSYFAEEGVLLSYSADRPALYRRAAYYVDRILKGAKPGALPIELPTKFQLVINLKTAKALGITMPQWLVLHADRVIG